jgi:uncharacterized LabA/DUF88 family protein
MPKTAILVDGGFYKKRALYLWGERSGKDRAKELSRYCHAHLRSKSKPPTTADELYRIFYYDCAPIRGVNIYHPLKQRNISLGDTNSFTWMMDFLNTLRQTRKFALRMGNLSYSFANYNLKPDVVKALFAGKVKLEDVTENDFRLVDLKQQGVDMRIGVDIASMAFKKQVDRMILIAGDSDFVPASKLARREGIDFILDPMRQSVTEDLFEHIDGLRTPWKDHAEVQNTQGNKT